MSSQQHQCQQSSSPKRSTQRSRQRHSRRWAWKWIKAASVLRARGPLVPRPLKVPVLAGSLSSTPQQRGEPWHQTIPASTADSVKGSGPAPPLDPKEACVPIAAALLTLVLLQLGRSRDQCREQARRDPKQHQQQQQHQHQTFLQLHSALRLLDDSTSRAPRHGPFPACSR